MKILKKIGLLIALFALITPTASVMAQDSILVPATALVYTFEPGTVPLAPEERLAPLEFRAKQWISDTTTCHFRGQVEFQYDTRANKAKRNNTKRNFSEEVHGVSFTLVGPRSPMSSTEKTSVGKKGKTTSLILQHIQGKDTLHLEFVPEDFSVQEDLDDKLKTDQYFTLKYDQKTGQCTDPVSGTIYQVVSDAKTAKGRLAAYITVVKTVRDPFSRRRE